MEQLLENSPQFDIYKELLLEWNQKVNLTAITDPEEIEIKHFRDSLSILRHCDIPYGSRLIDIGTGAGFPGVPIKIMRPDINLTLLDSLGKRMRFLEVLLGSLRLHADQVQMRAEDGARQPLLREQFDFAVARAVAPLRVLVEYCLPYVKVGGTFVAMKGTSAHQEVKEAENALNLLSATVKRIVKLEIAPGVPRQLVVIEKIAPSNTHYPRRQSQISKKPL